MKEYKYKINGQEYKVAVGDIENNIAEVSVNGTTYKVELEQAAAPAPVVKSVKPAAAPRTEAGTKVVAKPAAAGGAGAVKAPLPGVILDLKVNVGDSVAAGDTVVILEAMKMEHSLIAPFDGEVVELHAAMGDQVTEGAVLARIARPAAETPKDE